MNQRTTVAVIVKDGKVLSYGTNEHKEPCKRVGYPTGEGYELCDGCNYDNHAEANALKGSGFFSGATLYLLGHTYACDPCKEKAAVKGVTIEIV